MKHSIFFCIGGNIGNKADNFLNVNKYIHKRIGEISIRSSVYESEPWGFESADLFWNQVVVSESRLSPFEALAEIHSIEAEFDRKRDLHTYLSRQMDIDILYYGSLSVKSPNLEIPHPRIPERRFVLEPLAEIAPGFVHPLLGLTSKQLLDACTDFSSVKKIHPKINVI